jgi:hypothetical protein
MKIIPIKNYYIIIDIKNNLLISYNKNLSIFVTNIEVVNKIQRLIKETTIKENEIVVKKIITEKFIETYNIKKVNIL